MFLFRIYDGDVLGTYTRLLGSLSFWLSTCLIIITCLWPDFTFVAIKSLKRKWFPGRNDEFAMQEITRLWQSWYDTVAVFVDDIDLAVLRVVLPPVSVYVHELSDARWTITIERVMVWTSSPNTRLNEYATQSNQSDHCAMRSKDMTLDFCRLGESLNFLGKTFGLDCSM